LGDLLNWLLLLVLLMLLMMLRLLVWHLVWLLVCNSAQSAIHVLLDVALVEEAASKYVNITVGNAHTMPASRRVHLAKLLPLVYGWRVAVNVGCELVLSVTTWKYGKKALEKLFC